MNIKILFKRIFLGLLLGYAFFSSTAFLFKNLYPKSAERLATIPFSKLYGVPPTDYVSKWERNIVALKKKLPAHQMEFNYLSADPYVPEQSYIFFLLTQYSLAPAVFNEGNDQEWIILYTQNDDPKAWLDTRLQNYTLEYVGYRFYIIHQIMGK